MTVLLSVLMFNLFSFDKNLFEIRRNELLHIFFLFYLISIFDILCYIDYMLYQKILSFYHLPFVILDIRCSICWSILNTI